MTHKSCLAVVTLALVTSMAGTAGAQWRGGNRGGVRPMAPAPAPTFRPAPQPFRPGGGPVMGTVVPQGPAVYRPNGGYAPGGAVMGTPVNQGTVYRPNGTVYGTPVQGGTVYGAPGYGVQGGQVVRPGPYYGGQAAPYYGGQPAPYYGGGYAPQAYPVYGNYVPLVERYHYHPEYFTYVPGGTWFTAPDYLGMENNDYLGRLRGFMDQVQQSLGQRVQNGELSPDVLQQCQGERNYIEQVIAGDVSNDGLVTEDERLQLRELVGGMVALNNYAPQGAAPVDTYAPQAPPPVYNNGY